MQNRLFPRAKTIQERLNSVKKVANFEIAALFFRFSWVKNCGKFKVGNFFYWIESFLYCLSSSILKTFSNVLYASILKTFSNVLYAESGYTMLPRQQGRQGSKAAAKSNANSYLQFLLDEKERSSRIVSNLNIHLFWQKCQRIQTTTNLIVRPLSHCMLAVKNIISKRTFRLYGLIV